MTMNLTLRPAPQEYLCQEGAYAQLPGKLAERFIKKVLILHGENAYRVAAPFLPEFGNIEVITVQFNGECSDIEITRLLTLFKAAQADAIIGLGGGKVMDTAKAVGFRSGYVPVILLPTMASNCAAWTPLSVLYTEDGSSTGFEVYAQQTALLLVEPRVVIDSPIAFFIAGIADTLAKWYEADAILSQVEQPSLALDLCRYAAQQCHDIPLALAQQAVTDMRDKNPSYAWLKVMETNIMAGGLVGGFGDDYGRTAAAHPIHDALTARTETHVFLHGFKVAYGVLVQLALEDKWSEITKLAPFYEQFKLPQTLADLNLSELNDDALLTIAQRACAPGESIHFLASPVTPERVVDTIKALESFQQQAN
ncbi:glycerol dehydrogenase [Brochothrix campestris FSL F6-1037]|uniref:Glycerol dehydrogenase n=2 Tax=Brochothrix campestris TaxID=2757 RepID=W7CKY4_9LIST|nr:glycerol dehydrogenase [Brochothrix campestris FSL F6-1037]